MSEVIWRIIVDTNTLVSAICFPSSIPARVVDQVLRNGNLIVSGTTLLEFRQVLDRSKFDRYVPPAERNAFFEFIQQNAKLFEVRSNVSLCRDPKDNKFLALALDAEADILITGDKDLLALHPFGNVKILRPADFLAL